MKTSKAALFSAVLGGTTALSAPAIADGHEPAGEAAGGEAAAAEPAADDGGGGVGINVDLEIASAYVWRGANLWGPEQDSQNLTLFPGVTVSVDSISFGYWGAYQLTGDTKGGNVDNGVGAEQDLFVSYEGSAGDLGYSAGLTYYVYPFAAEGSASPPDGKNPMFIEPAVGVSYPAGGVDLGLGVSWYKGIQETPDFISHLYFNPSVGKSMPVGEDMELSAGLGFGYKVYTGGNNPGSSFNTMDVQVDVGLNVPLGDAYVGPAVHAAWTNLPEPVGFGDELAYWGGVNVGYDL